MHNETPNIPLGLDYTIAQAYARGRIDAGEPPFMDPDGFTSATTVGAFAFHFQQACTDGYEVDLLSAWSTFMSQSGRTVIVTGHDEDPEDEMPTVAEAEALRAELGTCGMSRTYVAGGTVRCTLRLGHSASAKHSYTRGDGTTLTWTTEESDQVLADRVHYVPASQYSTMVTRTPLAVVAPVPTDEQVATDLRPNQGALRD